MAMERFTIEQIIIHLREADVLLLQDLTVGEVFRHIGVSEQTYYRWRREYGRLNVDQACHLKALEPENARLKRVERIWRRQGLKVPNKQPKRGRLWLNDGSCIRLRQCWRNHVWAYDFVQGRTHDGQAFRMQRVIDEFSREYQAIKVARHLRSDDVLHVLARLFTQHDVPDHIRSDNGSEFTAKIVREWLPKLSVKTLNIEPGLPWENGYNQSFNGRRWDELLNGEIFYSLKEAKVLIEQ